MSSFENFVKCGVVSPLSASATSFSLQAAVPPYNLPPTAGGVLVLTDSPTNPSVIEVIRYTSRSALGLYGVDRGQEGTSARAWTGPIYCYQSLMAGDFQGLLDSKVDKASGQSLMLDTERARLAALNNVDNTADADKPISAEQLAALNLKAPLASPGLTGKPTAPTAIPTENSTQIASTAFVKAALASLVDSSPAALDTLNELAVALGNDPNFSTTMVNALAGKVDKAAGQSLMLDAERARLASLNNVDNTADANKPISIAQLTALNLKAPIDSPALTGEPTSPKALAGDNSNKIANTAFVSEALAVITESLSGAGSTSFLDKEDARRPAWKIESELKTSQKITVPVNGKSIEYAANFAVTLPALTNGSDYAIYATTDGRLLADLNWSAPAGETAGTTRKVGGFHVALTGEILPYSLWDLNYRPSCPDPRGMVCINGAFWSDIYLLGVNHHIDGTSRASVTIADGASPPKIPTIYNGNGSNAYANLTWFVAQDVLQSHGKRCPSWAEFSMLAFGVTEGTSIGTDPITTKHDAPRRSRWGVEQATGNLWVWGADTYGSGATGWSAMTDGRGSVYMGGVTAVLLGAAWDYAGNSGSRSAYWYNSPSDSGGDVSARGLSDHLCLLAER